MGCEGTPRQSCTCSSAFLLRSVIFETIFGTGEWKPFFLGFICSKCFGDQLDEAVMIQIAGGRNDNVSGREAMGVSIQNGSALELLHRFFGSKNRLAQRMIFPEILREDFVDEIVRIILVHLDFFENHATFARDVVRIENRMQHQIAKNLKRDRKMLVEHFHVEADTFLGGECVHVAADGVDLAGDLFRSAVLRSLEQHVLDEMRNAVPRGSSSREPVCSQIPIEAERICCICSVMIVRPLGNT